MQNFTENIAHQIKTPLTALSLALDRLEESGENRELLERCFEQIERIRSFISKLMTISRMEAGKIIMTEQDINVNSMLCDVVNQLPESLENGVSLLDLKAQFMLSYNELLLVYMLLKIEGVDLHDHPLFASLVRERYNF